MSAGRESPLFLELIADPAPAAANKRWADARRRAAAAEPVAMLPRRRTKSPPR
jgi:hypothetical protein